MRRTIMNLARAKVLKFEDLDSSKCNWVKTQKIFYEDPEGKQRDWECAARRTRVPGQEIDGVGILAILKKESGPEVLLQKQFRPPVNGICIEIPAGLLDPNETVETCAERELLEETGYVGKAFSVTPVMYNDPGFCNTNMKLVHVSVDLNDEKNKNPQPQLEDNEFIETFSVPLKTFPETMRELAAQGFKLDARVQNIADGYELARTFPVN